MANDRDFIPVIQPGASHCALVHAKSGDADNVQRGPGRRAEAGYIPRVLRDFWLNQGDGQHEREDTRTNVKCDERSGKAVRDEKREDKNNRNGVL